MSAIPKMSNYPGGFTHGITIRGIPITVTHPGEIFWVDENASHKGRGTFKAPDASIETCMSRCVAERGDIIMVKPGHVENISAIAGLTCDVASVAIVGQGRGETQAKILFDTADTVTLVVSAASVSFVNIWFEAGFADVAAAIGVTADGDYFTVEGCRITNNTTILNFLTFIGLAADADYFSFIGNDVHWMEGSAGNSIVLTAGESLGMRVIGNNIIGEFAESAFDLNATAITSGPLFKNNFMANLTAAALYLVEIDAGTVATFSGERYANAGATVPVANPAESYLIDCLGCDAPAISSLKFPAAPTIW